MKAGTECINWRSTVRSLHVAVAQIASKAGDIDGNLRRLKCQVRSAAAVGVEVILFAETVIHAYDVSKENLALAEPLAGPIGREMLSLSGAVRHLRGSDWRCSKAKRSPVTERLP